MQARTYWSPWAHFLQRWGVHEPVAVLLEAAGPLNILLAQLVYLGQPLFSQGSTLDNWTALAQMLENQTEARSFAAFLREEEQA